MRTSTAPHLLSPRLRGPGRAPDLGRLLLGLTVVALGVLFLLDSADRVDAGRAIDDFWPVLLVAAGVLTLAERPPSLVRGWLLVAGGGLLLLFTANVLDESAWDFVWPALIILVGLVIVARWTGRTIHTGVSREDVIRTTAVFSGPKLASTSQHFEGAWLTAVFGGVTLDLRGARPAPDGASVNATVAFGGVEILVPRGWHISVRGTPILGGVEDKTDRSEPPAQDAPTLHIDALSVFGGVEIKHEK
jgi:cell wall-active antibiotic response 4TMS protein YvqF